MTKGEYSYKYYRLGQVIPIRVVYNESGLKAGAEIPNKETKDLRINFDMLRRVEESPEVDEIDRATFDELCERWYSEPDSG